MANQIAAESSATPGDVKNVLDRYAYYVKENLKKGYSIQLLGFGNLTIRFITTGTAKTEKEANAKLIQGLVPSFTPSFKTIISKLDTKAFGLKETSRIKAFVFKPKGRFFRSTNQKNRPFGLWFVILHNFYIGVFYWFLIA